MPTSNPMRPFLLALLVSILALVPLEATVPEGWLTSVEAARAEARAGDKLILVDLYADWCSWCKVLEREVFSQPRFARYAEDMVLLRVDTEDRGEGSALQARFGAYTLPTTLIIDADLIEVGKVEGYSPLDTFLGQLDATVGRYHKLMATYRRVRKSDQPAALAMVANSLLQRHDGRRAAELYERLLEASEPEPADAARIHAQRAEALLVAEDEPGAARALAEARKLARGLRDPALAEGLALLRVRISQQGNDCDERKAALEAFVDAYPESTYRREADRALSSLDTCA